MHSAQLTLSQLLELAAGIVCPALFLVLISYMLGLLVFGPLYQKGDGVPPTTKFRIADILVLLVQLQLAAGLMFALLPLLDPSPVAVRVSVALFVWLISSWWWWTGVRMLAKARVERGADRLLFLSIVLPVGYLATVGLIASPVLLVLLFGTFAWSLSHLDSLDWEVAGLMLAALSILAVTIGSVFAVRWCCRYLVDHARDDVAVTQGIAFERLHVRKPTARSSPPLAAEHEIRILDEAADA